MYELWLNDFVNEIVFFWEFFLPSKEKMFASSHVLIQPVTSNLGTQS